MPALLAGVCVLGCSVAGLLALDLESTWVPESLALTLVIASYISASAATRVRASTTIDAGFVVATLALVLMGPAPALLVLIGQDVVALLERRDELRNDVRLLSGVATSVATVFCGSAALALAGQTAPASPEGLSGLLIVGGLSCVLILVNFAVSGVLVAVIYSRIKFFQLARAEFVSVLPHLALMAVSGALAAVLYTEFGLVGLTPLALAIVVPRLLFRQVTDRAAGSELNRVEATASFAVAIASTLGLDRRQRRILEDAASHAAGQARITQVENFQEVMRIVLYSTEHWDGNDGFPNVVGGDQIPVESRVVAVAQSWAQLATDETAEFTTAHALIDLRARAGTELDPDIVAVAIRLVEEELVTPPGHLARIGELLPS